MSAPPTGINGEYTTGPQRTWLLTLPPRWAMPCTSACFTSKPASIPTAASKSLARIVPWPPTPARMKLMVSLCNIAASSIRCVNDRNAGVMNAECGISTMQSIPAIGPHSAFIIHRLNSPTPPAPASESHRAGRLARTPRSRCTGVGRSAPWAGHSVHPFRRSSG